MFDSYEPEPAVSCPWCALAIGNWQGNDGPNLLFVWRQGERNPVDQAMDPESRFGPERLSEFVLPDVFTMTGWCAADHITDGVGVCAQGTWAKTYIDADVLRRAAEQNERDRIDALRRSWSGEA